MAQTRRSQVIEGWPQESREAAELVLKQYGEPDEATVTQLTWHRPGPWKRIVATRQYYPHNFPMPHIDCVESFLDYRVPPEKYNDLARFDGSVIVERTAGEVSARCHDEQSNFLALNLMHDIVTGAKSVDEARQHYADEVANFRRKKPTPYMQGLRFKTNPQAADPDTRILSDEDLKRAVEEGKQHAHA